MALYPNAEAQAAFVARLETLAGEGLLTSVAIAFDEVTATVDAARILDVLTALKADPALLLDQLVDVCGVDYPERDQRFDVVYHLLSMRKNLRLRIKLRTDEDTPVPSVVDLFPTAGWFEREAWDMYGIFFAGNPDLRRILTDYGFEGHPLRKDFPLTGYVELRYDEEQKRVVYEPVKLTQEFRRFDFLSPWEGAKYVLPGDEKATAAAPPPAAAPPAPAKN
ncbi:NADH-quinone oxidoreductase subunit C [Zavarzinia compransoris]|uniref:NADH-quinone oxidoreductase subunit C n=1 Tax=Zavarzinia compransoris TaxID=1264899 RepID=A0A317EBA9_9PROT|nr:NADH-quinone oxidoreductase subunit C [Zavarzinia compransoris]PWR23862.1 NADH-quinone oxidoreductase subunit C [Zavarzinia compransoris]TDP48100.1 NADH dehydrogenase subunit C [Zavarzinia compransoris]